MARLDAGMTEFSIVTLNALLSIFVIPGRRINAGPGIQINSDDLPLNSGFARYARALG